METINFGKPNGSARMAAVAIVVPAEPPSETTPSMDRLFKESPQYDRGSERHSGYASASVSARLQRGEILVRRGGDLNSARCRAQKVAGQALRRRS